MYCIERKDAPGQWTQELCFKTEFKAFVHARTKSLATMGTYRVVESLFKEEVFGCAADSRLMSAVTSPFIEQKASPRTC